MNKKSLEKTYEKVKTFLEKAVQDTMTWLKSHKKLVLAGAALYFAYTFLFNDEEEVEEE